VALADELANGEDEGEPVRVRVDLEHALVDVGDDVDARHALVAGLRIEDIRGPVPVVADEHDVADAASATRVLRRRL
jgi:hypothetical protein